MSAAKLRLCQFPAVLLLSWGALAFGSEYSWAYAAIAIQEFSDFTLQMPGAAVLFVVLAAIAIHRPSYGARDSSVAAPGR